MEGGNVYNDNWVLEHVPGTPYSEPSGDACDHYHRYRQDIALLAELGFTLYRFSLEWSRIEPEEGEFSLAELDHYRRMLTTCHEHGITPMVTFHHFTSPRWLAASGGWEAQETPEKFARFCERAMAHLGDLIPLACTLNEVNIGPDGALQPEAGAERTQTGDEFWPEALEATIRRACAVTGLPVIVSALDNFEWNSGYRPTFGLISVDRRTQERTVKPSARWLGHVAQAHGF